MFPNYSFFQVNNHVSKLILFPSYVSNLTMTEFNGQRFVIWSEFWEYVLEIVLGPFIFAILDRPLSQMI